MQEKVDPAWTWLGYGSREDMVWELEHHDRYFYYKDQMYGLSIETIKSKDGSPCFSIQYRDPEKDSIDNFYCYDTWDELIDNVVIDGVPFVEILEKGLTD